MKAASEEISSIFAEFRKRIGNKCTPQDSRAFYEFQQRRGKRRVKLNIATSTIPMELKVEKALEGIYACCFKEKATRIAEGGEEENLMSEKRLPKEAIQMQMKDLEFLLQQNIES